MHKSDFSVWRTCQPEFLLQKFRFASFLLKFTTRIFTRKCKKSELRHKKQTTIHFNYKSIVVLLCICYKYAQLGFLDELQIVEVLYRNLQVGFSVKKSELWVYCSNMKPIPFFYSEHYLCALYIEIYICNFSLKLRLFNLKKFCEFFSQPGLQFGWNAFWLDGKERYLVILNCYDYTRQIFTL